MSKKPYKRVLLKLSGEAFKGKREYGIDPEFLTFIADEVKKVAILTENLALVEKMNEIPILTLKSVITNHSLYL